MTAISVIQEYAEAGKAYRRWYRQARCIIARIAQLSGFDPGRIADVVAITSPRVSVTRNMAVALAYLMDGILLGDIARSTRVAMAHYEATGEIRGPKTSAFAKALRGDDDALVIDTHIARAFGYEPRVARSKYVHQAIGKVVTMIARRRKWTIVEAQAAIWAGYYRAEYRRGRVPLYDISMVETAMPVSVMSGEVPF